MKMNLDLDNIRSIELDFPTSCYPTCNLCGNPMDEVTIMPTCIYLNDKQNKGKYPLEEAKSVHFHFHHRHHNSVSLKTAYYCPLTNNRW